MLDSSGGSTPTVSAASLEVLQYVPGGLGSYQGWSANPNAVTIPGIAGAESATIDVDSTGRMWIAYTQTVSSTRSLLVRYSDAPYSSWSDPIQLATGLSTDDISSVIAMPGQIGVFWSNQKTKLFGFSTHDDGDVASAWIPTKSRPRSRRSKSVQEWRTTTCIWLSVPTERSTRL